MTALLPQDLGSSLLSQGNTALRRKNYTAAITHYQNALNHSPHLSTYILANIRIATDRHVSQLSYNPVDLHADLLDDVQATTFDSFYYLERNRDVRDAQILAENHYYEFGEREGRKPNAYFDPVFYLRINADVRAAGVSAFGHYREHGFNEGRLGARRKVTRVSSTHIKPLLFVGHDGIQAGSEVVLLEIIKWFHKHTTRRLKLLLLSPGPISSMYTEYADTYVLPGYVDDRSEFATFLKEDFEFTYINTVVSGTLFSIASELDIPITGEIVSHIHEMQNVIETYPKAMTQLIARTKLWISASPRSTGTLTHNYKIPNNSIITVPAFINPLCSIHDYQSFRLDARSRLGISDSAFVVVGCGTVYPRKGVDLFIDTARKVRALTDVEFQFVWIGDGPDLNKHVSGLNPEELKYILLVGGRSDANKMLACGDLFFMSSREDPFPLVVLEAAQHKIPSICFRPATGIVDFIEKDAGYILNKICTTIAASLIFKLLTDREKIKRSGECAYEKLHSLYTSEVQTVKIFEAIADHTSFIPAVSIIVPFFNHKKYIAERLSSIQNQATKDVEIIILDDASTDGTKSILSKFSKKNRVSLQLNNKNSGSPFIQWSKGISLAKADIIWIAEGDDSCQDNFLKILLPAFNDPLVNISAAKTILIDEFGTQSPHALDTYMNNAYQNKFDRSYKNDGFEEINQQLGAVCTLVNASGLLIRKSSFGPSLIKAQSFKMAGDWFVYLECLKNGKLNYSVETKNFFRRHSQSQMHKLEGSEQYFLERERITEHVVRNCYVDEKFLKKAFSIIDSEWDRFSHKHLGKKLEDLYSKQSLNTLAKKRVSKKHAAFYVHGMMFSQGGIERLAAQLANFLVSKGWKVTIYCRTSENTSPTYPLYEAVRVKPLFDDDNLPISVVNLRRSLLASDVDVFVPMLSEWLFDPIVEAAQHTGIPIIASEHNDPWKIQELWWTPEKRAQCFAKVDKVHLLLNRYADSLPPHLTKKIEIIPNGVNLPPQSLSNRRNVIVSVGRLELQKRYDLLILAVATIQESLREHGYSVEIYGEGQLKQQLLDLINKESLNDLIQLKGKTNNIEDIYRTSRIFALASDFEGLPMTLLEAFSFSLPAVAFKECNGPNEVILDQINGRLVESIEEFGGALLELMTSDKLAKYAEAARYRASEYSLDIFFSTWEKLLHDTVVEQNLHLI